MASKRSSAGYCTNQTDKINRVLSARPTSTSKRSFPAGANAGLIEYSKCNTNNKHHQGRAAVAVGDVSVPVSQLCAVAASLKKDVKHAPIVLVSSMNITIN